MKPENLALLYDPEIHAAIKAHAISEFPKECCGAIFAGAYRPMVNVHPDPEHFFDCDLQIEPLMLSGQLVALVHSHPNGPEGPSARDQEQQRAFNIPWGLVMCDREACSPPYFWGDMLDPPPLEGRLFRHGPSGTDGKGDCGAIVRDWYRLNRGVLIPDFPRDDRWWLNDQHLYLANYTKAGFVLADRTQPEIGDVALLSVGNKIDTANHAAIYIGGGLILHHLERRLSRVEPFVSWNRFLRAWLRHGHP